MSKPLAFRGITIFSKLETLLGGEGMIFESTDRAEVI
jgi:hypothetical protein